MKVFWIFFVLSGVVFGGEREVWYGADGKVVRVVEDGEAVEEIYQPPWERRAVERPEKEGVFSWDRRTYFGRGIGYPIYRSSYLRYPSNGRVGRYYPRRFNGYGFHRRGGFNHRGYGGGVRFKFRW